MEKKDRRQGQRELSASFVTGAIAFVFLIIGFQIAVFINRAAVSKFIADRSAPDTVYIAVPTEEAKSGTQSQVAVAEGFSRTYEKATRPAKHVENFRFNPNTVSISDLQRLGFSEKQAQSIDNYRKKGGKFSRKTDFAKSFVVSDSVYQRLEPFIDIPLIDLNSADTTALKTLPGIGSYFARKIVEYREELGGYSSKEQLLDIWHFDLDKFNALQDLIYITTPTPTDE